MDITRTTVPGVGVVHHFLTRGGQRFGVLLDQAGLRSLLLYGPDDPDVPVDRIALEHDEADQIAEVLHSAPIADRLASLERRLAELHGGSA
ncbi:MULTISPECIES: hypothetical protein [unclassified Plantactinospora]|uniref:hypothetical protein n=1 Tax=unclassified Plantactinospora TaxID=2631981 RepID=UPI000D16E1D8|nr:MULTISPECIES: hypothetical protein [unclassified Plantactinospora]AVT33641.1 hypothetical protein C6361_34065 [Plantactinospora sp. BC1]AVT39604.1 hypothetical protein C6W10_27735 [Plantactinospora sp. BB1]